MSSRPKPIRLDTIVVLILIVGFLFANAANGDVIDDPDQIAWTSVRNFNADDFDEFSEARLKAEDLQIDIEVNRVDGETRFAGIWQRNTDDRKWSAFHKISKDAYADKQKEMREKNFRLIDQEIYRLGDDDRYAGIWVENRENMKWRSFHNLSEDEFDKRSKDMADAGFKPIDIEVNTLGESLRISAIFIENMDDAAWTVLNGVSASGYASHIDTLKLSNHRVVDVESYRVNGERVYAAIFIKNKNQRDWFAWQDLTVKEFDNKWRRLKDEGYRLVDFEQYETAGEPHYAGIWRQNGTKPDWPHKKDFDEIIEAYRERNEIPGMGVAVAENGNIVYARGFGFANIEQNKEAHAGTIFRLASISKPITALLALRLQEQNRLSLSDKSRQHAPSLPEHHTHSIRELIFHQGGVRHYKGTDRGNGCKVPFKLWWRDSSREAFATATAAATLFQDNPLIYKPGTNSCYSTHGYTLLAAALEGASGRPYTQMIHDEFSQRLGLPTLRPEEVSRTVDERTTIYRGLSTETSRDVLNWKHAGGGLEASVIDLAQLGIDIINNKVVKEESRRSIWGDVQLAQDGSQTGARSFWWINFQTRQVIGILSNRKKGDVIALTRQLANAIN